ncbi:hypothetical protein FZC78_03475 [Rossellomorea vietnamensis]|uniref:Uncharacterized protein n=1 Tax=Rossellomorea vietnamensis TaxID=218284 RepID=A0A5D4NYR0_9BACI|nr:hypothetical protein [Rossellomorea vietnamensis]TYS18604.1 hypothetical protein FZC78_03475 [Rossellomorea vietnamensis]
MLEPRENIVMPHILRRNRKGLGQDQVYPSTFYSKEVNREENEEKPQQKIQKKTSSPLILPPPPIVSTQLLKKADKDEEYKAVERYRKDEVIPVPEDEDEFLYEKERSVVDSPVLENLNEDELPEEVEETIDNSSLDKEEVAEKTVNSDSHKQAEKQPEEKECPLAEDVLPSKRLQALLPVLLIQEEVEIELFNSFTLMRPLSSVSKVEWSVKSYKGCVLLPSNKVFLELILSADVDFVSEKDGSLQSLKMFLPLHKTVTVDWKYPPDFSCSHRGEYDFREKNDHLPSTHRVWEEKLAQPITIDLRSFNLIWHDELQKGKEGKTRLGVQGTAKVSIEGVQKQLVSLVL